MEIIDDRDYGAFIPSDLDDFGLDIYEFRIYAHLSRRVGRRGECFEGVSKIAAICRIDKKTVTQKLKSLQSSRLINLQPRSGRTNSITLTHQSEWGSARATEPDPLADQPATGSTRQRIDTRSADGSQRYSS